MMVTIIDYEMGNLFSVQRACQHAGIDAIITQDVDIIRQANGIILPGVGAFGDAMHALTQLGIVDALREAFNAGVPIFGICLGMQLLMTESEEFGSHTGLNLVSGQVKRLTPADQYTTKVPHVGWNNLQFVNGSRLASPLAELADNARMYFVHSYVVYPEDSRVILTHTMYGGITFCSSLRYRNIFATQFHPERSGEPGLMIYRQWKLTVAKYEKSLTT